MKISMLVIYFSHVYVTYAVSPQISNRRGAITRKFFDNAKAGKARTILILCGLETSADGRLFLSHHSIFTMAESSKMRPNKSRLSLKRKHDAGSAPPSSSCDSALLDKTRLLSADDTLFSNLVAEDFEEEPVTISALKTSIVEKSCGLSPIPSLPSFASNIGSPSSPIVNKSLSRTQRCLIPQGDQLNDSLKDSDFLAIPEPLIDMELVREERDLFEESPQNDKTLSDSGCEGASLDDDEDKPWEDSVYVPVTPKSCHNITPKNLSSAKALDGTRSIGIQKLSHITLPLNKTKFEMTLPGLTDINWDESLRLAEKSPSVEDSANSSSFSQKFRQQLMSNYNRNNMTPTFQGKNGQNIPEDQCFFGLPSKVQSLIERFRGIKDLYAWQKECLSMPEVLQRQNLVYALPTSGGKTLVAEILLLKEILINRKNTIFILPYVAIVQEKVRALSQLAIELDFFVEEYAGGKGSYPPKKHRCKNGVYIATIEKALGLVHHLIIDNRLHEIGLVVVDELHLLGEGSRGATLESVLTNLHYCKLGIQIVGMSATIGNLQEISSFLNAKTYTGDFRPVELKEYIKCSDTIYSINRNMIGSEESPLSIDRTLESTYTEEQLKSDPDQIGALVAETVPDESCLVFCPSRKNCENVALLICQTLPKTLKTVRVEAKKALYKALIAEGNGQVCPILYQTLPFGVAYHHSGLTAAERRLLEEAFLAQTLCVICCTSTLAAGVNLPARRVILRSPYIGIDFMDMSRYKQMVGRAGRAGFGGVGESILICQLKDTEKVLQLLKSGMTESISHLDADDGAGLKALILHSVSLGLASCRSGIYKFLEHTLLWVQSERKGVDVLNLADRCIQSLVAEGGLNIVDVKSSDSTENNENVIVAFPPSNNKSSDSQISICIRLSTPLILSKIGEAAVKGSLTIVIAHRLYDDLCLAQEKLVLVNHFHLLYCITPYSMMDQIKPNYQVFFNQFMNMGINELKVAGAIGITEAVAVTVMRRKTLKAVPQEVVDRFYLTLMLYDLWHQKSIWDVSEKFQVSRGQVFSLVQAASSFASCVLRFCEVLKEFWCFKVLLEEMVQRLSHCCSVELIPLMELPAVKIGRARQLYNAGYRSVRDVAAAEPTRLIREVDHMPRKVAYQIVAAAKLILIQKAEALRDEATDFLDGLNLHMKDTTTPVYNALQ
ncbi:helicase POLQ-like isoform X2 [Thrips palmi]|uniref:Helicase POLQ-like isoform X2 n=1 Tax=Thrips palmi TaxID=161013 RepID=A0A6P9A0A7_THRPL|nr:helicase POLQ-like isoform X2 [Thrips palmi]